MKAINQTSQRNRSQHGYVLVMALLLIAFAGSVLAVMARRGIFEASDITDTQQQLKHRWAAYSLEKSILPQAKQIMEKIYEKDPPEDQQPMATSNLEIQLGSTTYQLTLADEQAKANVNLILNIKGNTTDTAQAIRNLMTEINISNIPKIALKPYKWDKNPDIAQVHTFDQVFTNIVPDTFFSNDPDKTEAIDVLTCWGSGQLNFHTASPEVLKIICHPLLGRGQIEKIITQRKSNPEIKLNKALTDAGVSKKQIPKILKRLTEDSTCYSLRIQWQNERKVTYRLSIAQQPVKNKKTKPQTPQSDSKTGKLIMTLFEW